MPDSIAATKSYAFAIRIVKLYRILLKRGAERALIEQLLRSGTSITANLSEAIYAHGTSDFVAKVRISLKECAETRTWLSLLHDTGSMTDAEFNSIEPECTELLKMLSSTIRTIQGKEPH